MARSRSNPVGTIHERIARSLGGNQWQRYMTEDHSLARKSHIVLEGIPKFEQTRFKIAIEHAGEKTSSLPAVQVDVLRGKQQPLTHEVNFNWVSRRGNHGMIYTGELKRERQAVDASMAAIQRAYHPRRRR